mgnify:CR=1 FL=1
MIRPQFLNLLNSSFLLFIEHFLLEKGQGFNIVTGQYSYVGQTINNYYTYSSPVQPQVADNSITPPMTGVYAGITFYKVGQGNLTGINYRENKLYFNAQVSSVSGVFPLNDINLLPLDISEEKLLFETKFKLRNNTNNITSDSTIKSDEKTYPAIYYSSQGLDNKPFEFGGKDETDTRVHLFLICDSKYQLDALSSILNDSKLEYFSLLTPDKMPFNYLGGFKNTGVKNLLSKIP